jgi:hypothetical protein
MTFNPPIWDPTNSHYIIKLLPANYDATLVPVKKDENGNTVFNNEDTIENVADTIIHKLIDEGTSGKWFTKLPSHEQLMKRVRHTFKELIKNSENAAFLDTLYLTPKQITLVWSPTTNATISPQISFESDSDSKSEDSSVGDQVEVTDSQLPPVELKDDQQETQGAYLLTRLRAAKARVEAEQIRMQYFETTGRMPPDSDSEDE